MAQITCTASAPTGSEDGTIVRNIPSGTQDVRLVGSTAPQAVTGTFWQATQPVSIADGQDVTVGAKTDAKSTATDATSVSIMQVLKQISASVQAPPSQAVTGTFWQSTQPVSIATMPSTPVTGTFWQATQPVSIATMPSTPVTGTFWQATQPVSGTVTANQGGSNWSINKAQVNGSAVVTSVTGVQDVMPRKRTGSTGLSPNYYSLHKTDKTTTTMTASTCYVQSIVYCCTGAGTSWTLQFKDKSATPLALTAAITLAASTTPVTVINLAEPIIMTSGVDIITAGTTAGTVDIWVTYWQ